MLSLGLAVGIAVGVAFCIGALVALVLFGLRHYGWRAGNVQDEKADMEWDNSELNITVNPLDVEGAYEEDDMCAVGEHIVTDDVICKEGAAGYLSDEDRTNDEGPGAMEAGEETVGKEIKELEWDDSVLAY